MFCFTICIHTNINNLHSCRHRHIAQTENSRLEYYQDRSQHYFFPFNNDYSTYHENMSIKCPQFKWREILLSVQIKKKKKSENQNTVHLAAKLVVVTAQTFK